MKGKRNAFLIHETLRYPCGCEASGTYPLPTYCPTHGTAPPAMPHIDRFGCGGKPYTAPDTEGAK